MSMYATTSFTRDDIPTRILMTSHSLGSRSVFLASDSGYVTYNAKTPADVDALAAVLLSAAHQWRLELKAPKVEAPKVEAPKVVAADGVVTGFARPIMPPAPPTGILWPNGTQTYTTDSGDAA